MAVTKGSIVPGSRQARPDIKGKTASVELIVEVTGTRNGEDWPARGVPFSLPADEAADMVEAGMAVIVDTPTKSKKESATVAPAEDATA